MSRQTPKTIFEVARGIPLVPPASRLEQKLASSNLVIEADPAVAYAVASGVLTLSSLIGPTDTVALTHGLDITFNCNGYDANGDAYQGVGFAYALAYGEIPFVDFTTTATAYASASGAPIWGNVFTGTATAYAFAYGDILLENLKSNWVKWSNIGSLDFTVGRDNVAGERPLDWKGFVYAVKKLGNKAVVYGKNGVSILIPAGNTYGLQTVHKIGLKGKQAVAGDDAGHFFVDTAGRLFILGELAMKSSLFDASMHPEKLDYSEYLGTMSDLVLSWDKDNGLLYICDGEIGYVYSPGSKSLGRGPANVTGVSSQGGTLYVAAPATILMPNFEKCTDIYDFGTRKLKTVFSLEYGINVEAILQAKIDYRLDKAVEFSQTSWHDVDEKGFANITCNGREFRFRTRLTSYEWITLDYINVNGEVLEH